MGSLRFYTNSDGDDVVLSDHEGYVAIEVTSSWYLGAHQVAAGVEPHDFAPIDPDTGTHWTSTWASDRPAATGRCRAACDCGWTGSITTLVVDDPTGEPSEAQCDELLHSWRDHTDDVISLEVVTRAARQERAAQEQLVEAVTRARYGGHSWTTIGRALGVTKQAAHARFRHADPHRLDPDQE